MAEVLQVMPGWRRAAVVAAIVLWAPALAPFVYGPLRECSHCVGEYVWYLPIVPGLLPAACLGLHGVGAYVVGGIATGALFAALCLAARHLGRGHAAVVQSVVALAVLAESLGFASLLRA